MSFLCFGVPVVEAAQRPEDHTARSADLYQSACPLDVAGGICTTDVLAVSMLDHVYRLRSLIPLRSVRFLRVFAIRVLL